MSGFYFFDQFYYLSTTIEQYDVEKTSKVHD